jgi:pyruvate/2-oxoglutarate dehydrogenase complex dihydrolipoamide dehydrogenase (E3) component
MSRYNEYDLMCIGSGPAGQRAAIQAAKLGKKTAVIEKQQCIGGVCIETGTIPSKTDLSRGGTSALHPAISRRDGHRCVYPTYASHDATASQPRWARDATRNADYPRRHCP